MSRASGKLRQSIGALAVVLAGSLMTAVIAHTAELSMRPALNDLVPQFERHPSYDFLCNRLSTS